MKNIDKISLKEKEWQERKLNATPDNMNPDELERLLREKKAREKYIEEENKRMKEVYATRDKKYFEALRNHCLSGNLREREQLNT